MKNPFRFGEPVKGIDCCNRLPGSKELQRAIINGYSTWICSSRGTGKTSLILETFEQLQGIKTLYIDLYNIQSLEEFAAKFSRTVLTELFDWKREMKSFGKKVSRFFKMVVPKISFDHQGNPSISIEPQLTDNKVDIENILDIPEKIAEEKNLQVCIAFDEFQEVHRIEPFLINWMRSAFQAHEHVSYVFLGSKQSLMETIFADSNSPFYEFGMKIPVREISDTDWMAFIKEKFDETGVSISEPAIRGILTKSGGHPHFTQYFASVVWEFLKEGYDENDPGFAGAWMNRIIDGQSIVFQNIFDQLNQNQRKVLLAISQLKPGEQLFSAEFRKKYRLPASSTLTVNIRGLMKKDLLNKVNGTYSVANPVMKEWLLEL